LPRGEPNGTTGPAHDAARRIELDVGIAQHHVVRRGRAPRQRPQAREELIHGERLGEIVVGSSVETVYPVVEPIPGREHQEGSPASTRAVSAADLEPIDIGEPDIENDKIVRIDGKQSERGRTRLGPIDCPRSLTESPAEKIGQLGLVLDDQDAHLMYRPPGGKAQSKLTPMDVRSMTGGL